jgi:hypothetical protein
VKRAPLLLFVLVLVLPACGGQGMHAGDRLSYEEFGARTEAICVAGQARAAQSAVDPAAWSVRRWRRELAFDRLQVRRFRQLRPPVGLDRKWTAFVRDIAGLIDVNEAAYASAQRPSVGSARLARVLARAAPLARDARRLALDLPIGGTCKAGFG